jgi:peptide/nickel transport system permease protein
MAVALLVALHAAILLAGVLAPYPYAEQHRDFPYAPPTGIHFAGLRPFADAGHRYPVRFFVRGRLFGVDPPGVLFLCGSDGLGRDVFSRLLYGGQVSLFTGLLATVVSLSLALVLGAGAGFFGGWTDRILMRSGELTMAVPWLYLLLGVRAFLPLHIGTGEAFLLLIAIIGGIGWARPARLVRGVALSGREEPFVLAARGFGGSSFYLLRRHVMPLAWPVLVTQATILAPQYVMAEVTLSFLGLGIGEPVPSWGNMLAEARQYYAIVSHPWLLAPGLAVIPFLLVYLRIADGLLQKRR